MSRLSVVFVIVAVLVSLVAATVVLMTPGGEWDPEFPSVERAVIDSAR